MSEIIEIEDGLRLVPYYPNEDECIKWYQDKQLCLQVDGTYETYSLERLRKMYSFLNENGELFYIEYEGKPVGDICLRNNEEVCIAISSEFQNRHIGRKCVRALIPLARTKKYRKMLANSFNKQSYRMFKEAGFMEYKPEWLVYYIPYPRNGMQVMPQADIDMLVLDKYEEKMK